MFPCLFCTKQRAVSEIPILDRRIRCYTSVEKFELEVLYLSTERIMSLNERFYLQPT